MESSFWLLLVLLATLAIIHIIQAQDQEEFTSLDCGLPADELSPYIETYTHLNFSSDATFIQSGKTARIQMDRLEKPYATIRYFPDGRRNCYNLNVQMGRKYLIRASFIYGNYDGLDSPPVFDLYLGPNLWATIDTGETTPLISALELRPMGKDSYTTKSGSLKSHRRYYLSKSGYDIRYSSDIYDRVWTPYFKTENWTQISTDLDVVNSNKYAIPKDVLKNAATPTSVSSPLTIEWIPDYPDDQYYFYAHFAEIPDLQANETREFNVLWNGVQQSGPFIPRRRIIDTISSKSPLICTGGKCSFQLIRTKRSTLPPLLNALEFYTLIQFTQSETDESDVGAIKNIAATYALNRISWQGDPCVPQQFRWDGLNCTNTNMSTPPRITTLNLSSSGLTGTIAAAIQNLTQLETMDLSNNNLTGGLPDFLGNMKSLSVMYVSVSIFSYTYQIPSQIMVVFNRNLSGNNLSGSIPQALQREGLKLLVEGNPKLCFSDSCIKPHKKKPVVPIVASVVSAAVVIAILVLFLIFKNKKSTVLQGFISLDCGLPVTEPSPYNELSTGLQFSSDAKFIQSGKIGKIQANLESQYLKPYTRLRYFPEGIRNCYNLPVENNRKYLIRARFVYGNYDDLNTYPQFDLHLGPNPWATIDLQEFVNGTVNEIIHTQTSNSLQICLVKTGKTTPMISALELRPLGNNSYNTESGSLNLFIRMYANKTDGLLRYPDDAYDRSWFNFLSTSWSQIFTTLEVSNDNNYAPPKKALATAAIPSNLSAPLTVSWTPEKHGDQYYLYNHFAEIQDLHANDTREFDVLWNGAVTIEAFVPSKLLIDTFMNKSPETCDGGKCSYQLIKTSKSTLPPLLNALEIYTVIQFPQSETDENDVVAIKDIETAYGLSRIKWQGDPCVPQMYAWDGLNCSYTAISTPPRITSLNLSSSGLTGTIAAGIQNLTLLQKLDLSNNKLTGAVPEFLVQMTSLVIIVEGNPRLCISGSCTKDSKKKFPLIIVASVASVAIIVIVLILVFVLKKKKPSSVEAAQRPPITPNIKPSIETKKRRFTYSEVMKMTNNFQTVVGEGGFGVVCHGTLNDSEQVAVKLLSQSSSQGYKHFKAEVDLLLRVHYTNLVNLVGYCDEGDHLALIYEFMPNGDLKQHLSGKRGGSIFKWGSRLQIALEAALGLEYLHVGCTPPIVHRDIKTTNILLDQQLKAKIADFGLSRSFPVGGETHVSTVVAGTPGYLDPEYYHTSRLGEKSDVYSFGIVLLEMITNQPVIDQSRQRSHIAQWVGFELNRGDITSIIDPNLHRDYESRSVWRALELAMSCVNPSSANRPNMSQVANELKECLASEKSRRNMNMDSQSSPEVSISFDTGMFPRAR
ncbi:unnamed protein product [Brassica napus]|uniref:(rape) hypothetical protein n=2 Tax=Brassica TaxID=3705 RepID=A0A817B7Q3_BRANA|nr:unnamed protein product [Brassica napus]